MLSAITKKLQVSIFTIFTIVCFAAVPFSAKADSWGANYMAAMLKQALEVAREEMINAMIAQLKIQGTQMIRQKMESMLSGIGMSGSGSGVGGAQGTNSALFITNYETFIYKTAAQNTEVYMTSFFESLKSSGSGAMNTMVEDAEKTVVNEIFPSNAVAQITLDDYLPGGVQDVFNQTKGGGQAAFTELFNNNYNDRFGTYFEAEKKVATKYNTEVDTARTQAIAGKGYIGKMDPATKTIKTPGSLVADLTAYAESLPMQITATARSIPEVLSALASQMLTQVLQNGISKVTEPIDNQIRKINSQTDGGIRGVQSKLYDGINFK